MFNVGAQFADRRIPLVRVFGYGLLPNGLECARCGHRRRMHEKELKDRSERVNVGAGIDRAPSTLFWGHVARSAKHGSMSSLAREL